MQTTTPLQPDSSAILGRRPLGTYARNSPWIHTANQHCEWAGGVGQPGDLKENLLSSFDISLDHHHRHLKPDRQSQTVITFTLSQTVIITVTLGQTVIITVTLSQAMTLNSQMKPL
ncbi:hypothetical protein BV898_16096 [Hypsibius exemplaris]|uniref:Uncharacterized protein n=1 Tax=Hypsibius exemplaris TaxID=2072580 RepID=A0A9X6NF76_HYPEX|nr:hypothetical protein BV898_16096 [Hypsibius exemplaris]